MICDHIINKQIAVCMVTHDREEAVTLSHTLLRLSNTPATMLRQYHPDNWWRTDE